MGSVELIAEIDGCPIHTIIKVLHDNPDMPKEWERIAREMKISEVKIIQLEQDLLLEKITFFELLRKLLGWWMDTNGANAKRLVAILENNPKTVEVAEKLRPKFNFSSPELKYYVPRTLLCKNIVSTKLFEEKTSIFLLLGVDRSELNKLANGQPSDQIMPNSSVRFITLENPNHYSKFCQSQSQPVHMLQKREDGRIMWIRSSTEIATIKKHIEEVRLKWDEEKFMKWVGSPENNNQHVLIADTPGMGKSILLSQLERKLKENYPERTVAFFVFTEFIHEIKNCSTQDLREATQSVLTNLGRIQQSRFTPHMDKILIEILFDGFDELSQNDSQLGLDILALISSHFKTTRLWVTSRPQFLTILEKTLNVLAYQISPFKEQDQIEFLQDFWSRNNSSLDKSKLSSFAKLWISTLNSNMKPMEKSIAGIPLQCLLLAEVYEQDATEFTQLDNPDSFEIQSYSLTNLYDGLIQKKLKPYKQIYGHRESHVSELIDIYGKIAAYMISPLKFKSFHLSPKAYEKALNFGIIEKCGPTQSLRFLHRTFAEYFVAKYFLDNLLSGSSKEIIQLTTLELLISNHVLDGKTTNYSIGFLHHVICYFFNEMLATQNIPSNHLLPLNNLLTSFEIVQRTTFSCVCDNYYNIYLLLQNLTNFSTHADSLYNKDLLLQAASHCDSEFLRDIFQKCENRCQLTPSLKNQILQKAVRRGSLSVMEFLLKEKGFDEFLLNPKNEKSRLINHCVQFTSSKYVRGEIEELKKILELLVQINPNLLEETDMYEQTPLYAYHVDVQLLVKLLELGAKPLGNQNQVKFGIKDTLLHINENRDHLSNTEYHSLMKAIPKNGMHLMINTRSAKGLTPLMNVICEREPTREILREFKSAGANFNDLDNYNDSLLALAIKVGKGKSTIRELIKCGADIKWTKGYKRKTLIHYAGQYGNVDAVEILIDEFGFKADQKDLSLDTPMHYVENSMMGKQQRHLETALALQKRGAKQLKGSSLIQIAARDGNLDILMKYLTPEMKVSQVDATEALLALLKSTRGQLDDKQFAAIANKCGQLGASFNYKIFGSPLLHEAVAHGNLQAVKFMVESKNADINEVNERGETALHTSAKKGYEFWQLTKYLLEKGGDVKKKNRDGQTMLHVLMSTGYWQSYWPPDILQAIVNYFVHKDQVYLFDERDNKGATPLRGLLGKMPSVDILTQLKSCNFQTVDESGSSILLHASLYSHSTEIISTIIHFGANLLHVNNKELSALHCAARGTPQILKFLLELRKLDVNGKDVDGNTPLHYAVCAGIASREKVEMLLDHGARGNVLNNDFHSPLKYALDLNENEILELLERKK